MTINLSDPNSNELAKHFFYFETELDNLPDSHEKWRLQDRLIQLREAVEHRLPENEVAVRQRLPENEVAVRQRLPRI